MTKKQYTTVESADGYLKHIVKTNSKIRESLNSINFGSYLRDYGINPICRTTYRSKRYHSIWRVYETDPSHLVNEVTEGWNGEKKNSVCLKCLRIYNESTKDIPKYDTPAWATQLKKLSDELGKATKSLETYQSRLNTATSNVEEAESLKNSAEEDLNDFLHGDLLVRIQNGDFDVQRS